jgi:transposase
MAKDVNRAKWLVVSSGPMPRWARRPSCGSGGRVSISRPSVPCCQRVSWTATAKHTPLALMTWSRFSSTCCARSPAAWSSSGMARRSTAAEPWDGAPIHRSRTIRACLANGAAQRLHVERLPASAPELNPGEGLWPQRKGVELRNLCCFAIPHLHSELRGAVIRVRRQPRMLTRCFQGAGL